MQNYFIINTSAGASVDTGSMEKKIKAASGETGIKSETYYSRYAGDGERFIKWLCDCYPNETFRFFGCGGDGTFNEIANGCAGMSNAVAGIVPTGTGNDFIRYFEDYDAFTDIAGQLKGDIIPMDLISCRYIDNGKVKHRYCANMINIGFDSKVVVETGKIKKEGRYKGTVAYMVGVFRVLKRNEKTVLRIESDTGYKHDGPLLLAAVCNGRYCGGGVKNSPLSEIDDGIMDISVINEVSRLTFIRLFPSYKKGKHLKKLMNKKILDYDNAKKVFISSDNDIMTVSNDGEIIYTNKLQLEVIHDILKFSVPERIGGMKK